MSLEDLRASILRVFFLPHEMSRERLLSKRILIDDSWDESRHSIDPDESGELATGEDIVTDRDLSNIENIKDPMVDPLIVSADEDRVSVYFFLDSLEVRLSDFLSSWRKIDHRYLSVLLDDRSDTVRKWLDHQDCPSSTTIRAVIRSSRISYTPVSEIVGRVGEESLLAGSSHDARLEV